MAKGIIRIEFITKRDIRSDDIAIQIYQKLIDISPKLAPQFVNWHEPVNIPVNSIDTWLAHWSKPATIKSELGSSETDMGMLWSRRNVCRVRGKVAHHADNQRLGSLVNIETDWHKNIRWEDLFDELLAILCPEYASINLISPDEFRFRNTPEYLGVGTISRLVSRKYEGNWRRPDVWDKEAWCRYRFLPNLAWRTYFSKGFVGCYDKTELAKECEIHPFKDGIIVTVGDSLESILRNFEAYNLRRERAKLAFTENVFSSS